MYFALLSGGRGREGWEGGVSFSFLFCLKDGTVFPFLLYECTVVCDLLAVYLWVLRGGGGVQRFDGGG